MLPNLEMPQSLLLVSEVRVMLPNLEMPRSPLLVSERSLRMLRSQEKLQSLKKRPNLFPLLLISVPMVHFDAIDIISRHENEHIARGLRRLEHFFRETGRPVCIDVQTSPRYRSEDPELLHTFAKARSQHFQHPGHSSLLSLQIASSEHIQRSSHEHQAPPRPT